MAKSILTRIADGDSGAVQECLATYGGLVWSLARRLSPSQAEAEDAVQEIFIDVWRSASRFDETQASETAFVAMIARRRLIDRLRRLRREPRTEELSELPEAEAPAYDDKLDLCAEAETARRVLDDLRPEQRSVLELALLEGMTHGEISERTGMPLGSVKTHARRGLAAVRERLLGGDARAARKESIQ